MGPDRLLHALRWVSLAALLLVPGALTAFFAFNAGGFFPGTVAVACSWIAVLLALRFAAARRPLEGAGPALVVAVVALGCFAAWTLASAGWSDAPGRARVEYDRALLYGLTLVLFATVGYSARRLSLALYGVAAAIVAACVTSLAAVLLPEVAEVVVTFHPDRLSHPLTYWNALGIFAGVGVILCGHLATSDRHPAIVRVLGAAALPILAPVLYCTFSRGALWATVAAIVVYCLLGRPRGLIAGGIAALPPTIVAVATINPIDRLTDNPLAPQTVELGQEIAITIGGCVLAAAAIRAALIPLDRSLAKVKLPFRVPRIAVVGLVLLAVLGVGGTSVAVGLPSFASERYDEFVADENPGGSGGSRLLSSSSNGRREHWDVALDIYRENKPRGTGAGTYEIGWHRLRETQNEVVDGHSLYLEVMGELGWPGLVMLAAGLLWILVTFARRARGPDRALHAALFAAGLAWAIHAGLDWDWEMPAVTLWLFALGGLALARPAGRAEGPRMRRLTPAVRIAGVAGCAVLALTPLQMAMAQSDLNDANDAVLRDDCADVLRHAAAARDRMPELVEAYQYEGWCEGARRPLRAVAALRAGLEHDPDNWELHHGLAIALARAGQDPSGPIRIARALNPRDESVEIATARLLRARTPKERRRVGYGLRIVLPDTTESAYPQRSSE